MIDAPARASAAHDFERNVVVVAGAGTGKTSLLVERVICQMIARDLEVDRFAAITFTEKAAAEMRKRLADGLADLAALARDDAPLERADLETAAGRAYVFLRADENLAAARIAATASARLRDLVRAEISTIHGFCAGLLRRYPLESGVDPGFSVDTGLGFDELQVECWRDFLSGSDGPGGVRQPLFSRVLAQLDLGEVEGIGRACASFSIPLDALERGLPDAQVLLAPLLNDALREIDACVPVAAEKGPESWLDAARAPLEALRDDGMDAFRSALDFAHCRDGRGQPRPLLGSAPPTLKLYERAAELAKSVHRTLVRLQRLDDAGLADALELVLPFARAVRQRARVRGQLPFEALLALARDLLRNDTDVRRALGERYQALFLDEFQDTDPLQYEIVFLLAEDTDGPAVDDAFATRLGAGKLFIVGDPKQAIYRFRGADISAYLKAVTYVVEHGDGEKLELVTNFRARPEIITPIDRLFGTLLSAPDPASALAYSGYEGLVSGRAPAGEPRVEIWTVGDVADELSADAGRRAEADAISAWAATEIAAGRLRAGQIAILFRALRDVHVYARALQDRGVPCLIGRSEDLESQPAGQQILALLRALANPADAPAVLGVLRSPLGAVPDVELARWAGRFSGREREACWSYPDVHPPANELPNLARTFALLRTLRERVRECSPAIVLAELVERTPLLEIHARARDGERRTADFGSTIERLVEVARAAPGRGLAELVRELASEERRPAPDDGDAATERVRLSSIHAAKGLEFPVVILPDLARGKGSASDKSVEVELLRAADPRGHDSLAISTRAGISASWLEHERLEKLHDTAEAGRLFYVACTRAEERLIFVHAPRKQKPPSEASLHHLAPWGYTAAGRAYDGPLADAPDVHSRVVRELPTTRLALPSVPTTAIAERIARAQHVVALAEQARRAPFASPSGLREDAEVRALSSDLDPLAKPPESPGRAHARALGTALHDALERWDFRDGRALLDLARSAAQRLAAADALDSAALERDVRALAESVLASELPAYLAAVDVLGRELPILYRDSDGTVWNGSIDLLYRDTDGRLVVADYKTDRAADDAARARYTAQLSTYARGVARVFPGEPAPALELLWLRTGQRERMPLESPP